MTGRYYDAQNVRHAFLYQNGRRVDLGTLADTASTARGINASGQFVGSMSLGNRYHAFLYDNGTVTDIGTLPGDAQSFGRDINNAGQIVGRSDNFSYMGQAFLYSGGAMTSLGTLAGFSQSSALAINNSRIRSPSGDAGGVHHDPRHAVQEQLRQIQPEPS